MRVANVRGKNCLDDLEVPRALLDATTGRLAEIKSLTSESVQGERQTLVWGYKGINRKLVHLWVIRSCRAGHGGIHL